jgi:esterase/lipase superfamily enzyme
MRLFVALVLVTFLAGCSKAQGPEPESAELTKPPPGAKAVQPVAFATNRVVEQSNDIKLASITSDHADSITYGRAWVSIPDAHRIGVTERPKFVWWKGSVEKETSESHFRLMRLTSFSKEAFSAVMKNSQNSAMLFVHGYNSTFEDAIYKAAQIAFDANFRGTVAAFSWPSRGQLLAYDYDQNSADLSSTALLEVLKLIKESGVSKIYLVAHSLGSRVVMGALERASLTGVKLDIAELIFAAPDVDKDLFLQKAEDIKAVAGVITIYVSAADKALLASSKKAGDISRIGYVTATGPTLVKGMEVIDVTAVGDDMFGLNHGTFSASRSVLDDIGRRISSGTHPPNLRSPTLRLMPDDKTVAYWLYPK